MNPLLLLLLLTLSLKAKTDKLLTQRKERVILRNDCNVNATSLLSVDVHGQSSINWVRVIWNISFWITSELTARNLAKAKIGFLIFMKSAVGLSISHYYAAQRARLGRVMSSRTRPATGLGNL